MTTVAAFKDHNGAIAIAADSAITGRFQMRLAAPKIFAAGRLLVGFAGIVPPAHLFARKRYASSEAGVRALAKDYMKWAHDQGHGVSTEDGVRVQPLELLVVGHGLGPFTIGCYGEVVSYAENYAAIGSGAEFALGAMLVCREMEAESPVAAEVAVKAACTHDPGSDSPIMVVALEPKSPPTKRRTRK